MTMQPKDGPATPAGEEAVAAGGGSGGGDTTNRVETTDGNFSIFGNQISLLARPPLPPAIPGTCVITILSAGTGTDGRVEIRGSQGVRITAGPPLLPPATSESTQGVEIMVGEMETITIQRGLLPVDQSIVMSPSGIVIDAGTGSLTLKSLTQISLEVAGGLSTVTLGPDGVAIQGIMTKIN